MIAATLRPLVFSLLWADSTGGPRRRLQRSLDPPPTILGVIGYAIYTALEWV